MPLAETLLLGNVAARAGKKIDARIRTGARDIVLDHYRAALHGADDGRTHVAARDRRLGLPRVGAETELRVPFHALRIRGDGGEIVQPVAAVHVHGLHERHETVRRIAVAGVLRVPFETPIVLVAVPLRRILVYHLPEIVYVRALRVDELPEHPRADEIEGEKLHFAVAAVFELHAVAARALGRFDEHPAFFERHRGRDFHRRVLAVLHRILGHRRVERPRGDDIDEIEIAFAKSLPSLVAGIFPRLRLFAGGKPLLLCRHALGIEVAEGNDSIAGNRRKAVDSPRAAHAETDDAYPES